MIENTNNIEYEYKVNNLMLVYYKRTHNYQTQ